MKKKSILFLLLMGLCLPWAANAQEQNMLNGDAADNGGRGTMRIYKKVSSLTSGKNYLIVSSQTANSNAYALSQTSSTASDITASSVHINAGDQLCSTVYINSEGLEPTAVWKANSGWTFSHQKGSTTYYIYGNKSWIGSATFSANTSSSNWTYNNNTLYFHYSLLWTSDDYYITPSSSTFTLGTSSANVYLYEETDLTVFDITATVSPSGIGGTVTGAGRYLSGAQCELTATTNNSEFAFTNWTTMNGTVVSTANPYTFTVRADQDLVANFEGIVSCTTPINLSTSTVEAHSVILNCESDASNFNVQYRTIPDGTWLTTTASSNSFTLTGLVPETTYEWKVQANCGNNDLSGWSDISTFTTGIACFAPTNVTASNVTNNSAVINWTGEAESFNLRYGTIEGFSYGFEDAEPWNFTNFTPCTVYDGDGFGTGAISNVTFENQHYTGAFIAFQNGVTANADSHGGDAFGACFYATTAPNNDYFILPAITIENGYVFRFWAKSYSSSYLESFRAGVYNGNGNLTTVLGSITNVPNAWTAYTYDLSSYAGQTIQLAINCNSNDKFAFFIDDIFVGNPNPAWSEPITGVTSPYTLTGLDGSTDYEVQVQGDCGSTDGLSQWSASASFQTIDNCTVPFSLNYTDATCTGITLSWDGIQESYNVRYHNAITPATETEVSYNFNSDAQSWTTIDADGHGDAWSHQSNGGNSGGCMRAKYNSSNAHQDYLVSPQIYLGGTLSFYAKQQSTTYNDCFRVYLSTSGNTNISDFSIELTNGNVTPTTSYTQYTYDLSNYSGMGYVAIVYTAAANQYYLYVDDVNISGIIPATYAAWVTEANVTSPLEITGLMPSTNYEWQVQGVDCDGNGGTTDWSEAATFNTLAAYVKHIDPYTTDGGYYLIASPVGQINPSEVNGMLGNDYDLYYFDQTKDAEWINYKAGEGSSNAGFDLVPGKGYLYANSGNNGEGVDLVFARTAYTGSGNVTLALETGTEFEGMNLVGNPFADTAYIADGRDFYRLADGGAEVMTEAFTGAIEPMEGVFVYANNDEENMTFTTTNPSIKSSRLILNLTNGNDVVDRAMVRFGEGRMLPKFQLNQNSTKVYMTVEGKDYAVVYSDDMGEMPVGFKAETNGSYTFNFSNEEVNLSYLHLIDNMTGNDVDLLAGTLTGSATYTFEAKTTDYENRFKLVYATGNNDSDDTFAFFSNGSFVINNEGEATLQVIDINGRILKSESINGCANVNVNAAQGIYMLRLVNGDNVKVQKVVVR